MEGGGLRVAISLAMVHGAVWGVLYLHNGRSNFKNHHCHTSETTPPPVLVGLPPASPPPPGPSGQCMRA